MNSLCQVEGLVITDVFGDRTLIRAANDGEDSSGNAGACSTSRVTRMGRLATAGTSSFRPASPRFTGKRPDRRGQFLRDEMANLAWAVDRLIPDATGQGHHGSAAGRIDGRAVLRLSPASSAAPIRYVLGHNCSGKLDSPFFPVHMPGSVQDIRFQRGAMPKLGSPPREVIKAKGVMLNEVPPPSTSMKKRCRTRARF